uniref:Interleukin-4 n=1 Tax=Rhinolophus ferrumequinum TaxID=59479 RepID=A0A671FQL7_RHIFE
ILLSPSWGLCAAKASCTMYLYVLLACVLWGLESHSAPMKITGKPHDDNHTAVCAEIQRELSADNIIYNGSFKRPQNTSEESCYGQFIKDFISTLRALLTNCHHDDHLRKVYKNMKELPRICTKLQNCTTEISNFSQFKEALQSVVMSIEGWKSCKRTKDSL